MIIKNTSEINATLNISKNIYEGIFYKIEAYNRHRIFLKQQFRSILFKFTEHFRTWTLKKKLH